MTQKQSQTQKNHQEVNVKVIVGDTPRKNKRTKRKKPKPDLAEIPVSNPQVRAPNINMTAFPITPQVYRPAVIQIQPDNPMNPPAYFDRLFTNVEATMGFMRETWKDQMGMAKELGMASATNMAQRKAMDDVARRVEDTLNRNLVAEAPSAPASVASTGFDAQPDELWARVNERTAMVKSHQTAMNERLSRMADLVGEDPLTEEQKLNAIAKHSEIEEFEEADDAFIKGQIKQERGQNLPSQDKKALMDRLNEIVKRRQAITEILATNTEKYIEKGVNTSWRDRLETELGGLLNEYNDVLLKAMTR
jgi:hypothetical protein